MAKQSRSEELEHRIVLAVNFYPEGIGVKGLQRLDRPLRTLQRHLAKLVEERRLVAVGKGRARRYRALVAEVDQRNPPISSDGKQIRGLVRRPRHQRRPVGYFKPFLKDYRPNVDYYLPLKSRDMLHRLGTIPESRRPKGSFAREILFHLLVDFSWASSYLAGSSYNRLEAERLIEVGQIAEGKSAADAQMILNHKSAMELLVEKAGQLEIDRTLVLNLHAIISDGLLVDPRACGRVRDRVVQINSTVYQSRLKLPMLGLYSLRVIKKAQEIVDPFEQALFTMVHLPYLQPFEAMNRSLSRVVANISLITNNLYPLSFLEVSKENYDDAMLGVFELNRVELLRDVFIDAYERSCKRYAGLKRVLVEGDDFRLRYRSALAAAIKAVVTGGRPISEGEIMTVLSPVVLEEDRGHFVKMVLSELESLYSGNAMRFGLRPLQVEEWKKTIS